jgi:hypothetical protein
MLSEMWHYDSRQNDTEHNGSEQNVTKNSKTTLSLTTFGIAVKAEPFGMLLVAN